MLSFCVLVLCLVSGGLTKSGDFISEYQDSIGQYSFGYSSPQSARSEIRSADGKTRGAFSFVDSTGVIQTAKYTADSENGFRIEATYLPEAPKPVQDTPEVIAAREQHLRALEEARKMAEQEQSAPMMRDSDMKMPEKDQQMIMPMMMPGKSEEMSATMPEKTEEMPKMEQQPMDAMPMKSQEEMMQMLQQRTSEPILEKKEETVAKAVAQGSTTAENSKVNMAEIHRVPILRASFVVPAHNVNLHSRIELKSSGQSSDAPSAAQLQGIAGAKGYVEQGFVSRASPGIVATPGYLPYSPVYFSPYSANIYPYAHYRFVPTFGRIL